MTIFNGYRVVEDAGLVDTWEDWSHVRSPGRARRRRRYGYPQRIVFHSKPKDSVFIIGDKMMCHPVVAALLRAQVEARDGP
jgi:hypothetical protein